GGTPLASFTTSGLTVGIHTIIASYDGDSNFLASTGTLTQAVGKASSNTLVVSSTSPSQLGQSVTFTATVTASGPDSPTGIVTFFDGATSIGQEMLTVSVGLATASFSTTTLAVGSHAIAASYGGDNSFQARDEKLVQNM